MLVITIVLSQFIGHLHDLLVRWVAVAALIVEPILILQMIGLSPHTSVFQDSVAVFAPGHDSFDVSILVIGGHFERVDADRGIFSGVFLQHGQEDADVAYLFVFATFFWKVEMAHWE